MDPHSLSSAGAGQPCTNCPVGTFSVTEGATSLDVCSKCQGDWQGKWSPHQSSSAKYDGAKRAKQPVMSYEKSGDLMIAFKPSTPMPSFSTITVETSRRIGRIAGGIICNVYYNTTQGLEQAPVCDATVSISSPFTLSISLCALDACIPADTELHLSCSSNLFDNGPPGNVTLTLNTTSDSNPVQAFAYEVKPDSTPTSISQLGANRQVYAAGQSGGDLSVWFEPTRPLSPDGNFSLSSKPDLWVATGSPDCSVWVEGIRIEANATVTKISQTQTLTVQLDRHVVTVTEIQMKCSGSLLALNSNLTGPVAFSLVTSNDTVPLQKDVYSLSSPPPPPPLLLADYEVPFLTG